MHPLIRTERLDLVPLSLADAETLVHGDVPNGRPLAAGYPTVGTLLAAGVVVTAAREGRRVVDFGTYQIVRRFDGLLIGDCGFLGAPDAEGIVQVSYGIAESARNEGYATEALEGLIGFAFTHDNVSSVRCETGRDNVACQRVMEKAGMAHVGEDGETLIFEA